MRFILSCCLILLLSACGFTPEPTKASVGGEAGDGGLDIASDGGEGVANGDGGGDPLPNPDGGSNDAGVTEDGGLDGGPGDGGLDGGPSDGGPSDGGCSPDVGADGSGDACVMGPRRDVGP